MRTALSALLAAGVFAPAASAQTPHMGGEMNHVLVTVYQQQIYVSIERPDETPLTLANYHERYTGSAGVLNRSGYNAQFGWLANGFISLPDDGYMWVETLDQTPGLRTFEQGTFDPIFGTTGASTRWQWDGTMVHNWYSAFANGDYSATYAVFVGLADGSPYPGYTAGQITLNWTYPTGGLESASGSRRDSEGQQQIPAPSSSLLVIGAIGYGMTRRRRA